MLRKVAVLLVMQIDVYIEVYIRLPVDQYLLLHTYFSRLPGRLTQQVNKLTGDDEQNEMDRI